MSQGIVTVYSYDLLTLTLLAELPYTGLQWSQRLNAPGSFKGTLKLSDPRVQNLGALNATNPSKTLTIVDMNGQIVWGGINWTRHWDSQKRDLEVAGQEVWSYFGQRVQAADYTNAPASGSYWTSNPADPCLIAARVVLDAIQAFGSGFGSMGILVNETVPNPNTITVSYPITQQQAVSSIVSTLASSGYGTGFDFGIDWLWSNGSGSTPIPTLNIDYPRRGRPGSATSPVVMTGGDAGLGYTWPEDGTQQGYRIIDTGSGGASLVSTQVDSTPFGAFYPLLEKTGSYSNVTTQSQLDTTAKGDLAQFEWPVVTPTFTMPIVDDSTLGQFIVGDDERVMISPDSRFPNGVDLFMRVVGVDVKVPESGLATMTHAMTMPPALAPVPAPPI